MTLQEAKKAGSIQALKSVGIGLLIAQLIMTLLSSDGGFLKGCLWFTDVDYKLNLLIGVIIMSLCGYHWGQRAGTEILLKKRNYKWVGIKYGIITLLSTAFLSGWTGFFRQNKYVNGIDNTPFHDYILKPLFWIFIFGLFPAIIVGFWFGKQIKKRDFN